MSAPPSQSKVKKRRKKKKGAATKQSPDPSAALESKTPTALPASDQVVIAPIFDDVAGEVKSTTPPVSLPDKPKQTIVERKQETPNGPPTATLSSYGDQTMRVDTDDKQPLTQSESASLRALVKKPAASKAPKSTAVLEGSKGVFVIRRLASKLNEMLNGDHFAVILSNFDGHTVGKMATVCKKWHDYVSDPMVWRSSCLHVWKEGPGLLRKLKQYEESWKTFYLTEPHVRFDGYYLLKTTYRRPGGYTELGSRPTTVVEVTYFRYLRFFPNRKVAYVLMNSLWDTYPRPLTLTDKRLSFGQYVLQEPGLRLRIDLPHMTAGISLSFYQTKHWAHDCLIVEDFQGQSPTDEAPIHFKNPQTYFHFCSELEVKSPQ